MSVEFCRGSPGKFDSRTLNRETLDRWTGRRVWRTGCPSHRCPMKCLHLPYSAPLWNRPEGVLGLFLHARKGDVYFTALAERIEYGNRDVVVVICSEADNARSPIWESWQHPTLASLADVQSITPESWQSEMSPCKEANRVKDWFCQGCPLDAPSASVPKSKQAYRSDSALASWYERAPSHGKQQPTAALPPHY